MLHWFRSRQSSNRPRKLTRRRPTSFSDVNIITVGAEHVRCAKVLFHFINIMKCDVDIRKDPYANVVSSDGTAMFQVTSERMTKELTGSAPFMTKIMVVAPPERM